MTTLSWTTLFTNNSLLQTTFLTNLRARVDEDTEDIVTDAQFIAHIPQALNEIANKTRAIPEYMEVVYAGETQFTLPSNINEMGSVYYISGSATPVYVPKTSLGGARQFGWIRRGLILYVYGLSTGVTLRVFASRMPALSSANNNYIDLPDDILECLYLNLELFYWKRRRMPEEIQNTYNLYKEAIQDARDSILDNYGESVSLYGKNP